MRKVCSVSSSAGRREHSSSRSCQPIASGVSSPSASAAGGIHESTVMRTRKPHSFFPFFPGSSTEPRARTYTVSDAGTLMFFQPPAAATPSKRPSTTSPRSSAVKSRCAVPLSSERWSSWIVSCAAPASVSLYGGAWSVPSWTPRAGGSDCSVAVAFISRLRWTSASSRSSRGSALNGAGSSSASSSSSGFISASMSDHSFEKAPPPSAPLLEWYANFSRSSSSRGLPSCSRSKIDSSSSWDACSPDRSESKDSTACRSCRIASAVCAAPEMTPSPPELAPSWRTSGKWAASDDSARAHCVSWRWYATSASVSGARASSFTAAPSAAASTTQLRLAGSGTGRKRRPARQSSALIGGPGGGRSAAAASDPVRASSSSGPIRLADCSPDSAGSGGGGGAALTKSSKLASASPPPPPVARGVGSEPLGGPSSPTPAEVARVSIRWWMLVCSAFGALAFGLNETVRMLPPSTSTSSSSSEPPERRGDSAASAAAASASTSSSAAAPLSRSHIAAAFASLAERASAFLHAPTEKAPSMFASSSASVHDGERWSVLTCCCAWSSVSHATAAAMSSPYIPTAFWQSVGSNPISASICTKPLSRARSAAVVPDTSNRSPPPPPPPPPSPTGDGGSAVRPSVALRVCRRSRAFRVCSDLACAFAARAAVAASRCIASSRPTWVWSTSFWWMPTRGTGITADAISDGSIPEASTAAIAPLSYESSPCSALSARVCSSPKRNDVCSAGGWIAGAPPSPRRFGRKSSNAGRCAASSLKPPAGSGASSSGSSRSADTVTTLNSAAPESRRTLASESSAPSHLVTTPCSCVAPDDVWSSGATETREPTESAGSEPPSTQKAPSARRAAPWSSDADGATASPSAPTTAGTRSSAAESAPVIDGFHDGSRSSPRSRPTSSAAIAEPTCALRHSACEVSSAPRLPPPPRRSSSPVSCPASTWSRKVTIGGAPPPPPSGPSPSYVGPTLTATATAPPPSSPDELSPTVARLESRGGSGIAKRTGSSEAGGRSGSRRRRARTTRRQQRSEPTWRQRKSGASHSSVASRLQCSGRK